MRAILGARALSTRLEAEENALALCLSHFLRQTGAHSGGLIGFEPAERFAEQLSSAGIPITPDRFRIVSENSVVLWEMVRRGLGIGMMSLEVAERTPGIVRVLPALPETPVPVWLVSHRELRTSQRVRLVFETLAEELRRGAAPNGV